MIRFLFAALLCCSSLGMSQKKEIPETFGIPVEYYKLPNGLKVVLSPDPTAPIATVAVYYNIGFRIDNDGIFSAHFRNDALEPDLPGADFRGLLINMNADFLRAGERHETRPGMAHDLVAAGVARLRHLRRDVGAVGEQVEPAVGALAHVADAPGGVGNPS